MLLETGQEFEWTCGDGDIQGEEVFIGKKFVLLRPRVRRLCTVSFEEWDCHMDGAEIVVEPSHAVNKKQARFIRRLSEGEMTVLLVMAS